MSTEEQALKDAVVEAAQKLNDAMIEWGFNPDHKAEVFALGDALNALYAGLSHRTPVQPELLPCPFCGSSDALAPCPSTRFIECEMCGCFGPSAKPEQSAAQAWNTRHSIAKPQVMPTDEALDNLTSEVLPGSLMGREGYRRLMRAALLHFQRPTVEISEEEIEAGARAIYDLFEFDGVGAREKPDWVPRGNSRKQDEARRYARAFISALTGPA